MTNWLAGRSQWVSHGSGEKNKKNNIGNLINSNNMSNNYDNSNEKISPHILVV